MEPVSKAGPVANLKPRKLLQFVVEFSPPVVINEEARCPTPFPVFYASQITWVLVSPF